VKFWGILSRIRNSAGTLFGPRGHVRFNDSASVTWTVTDDPTNDEIDVSATAAGGGGAPTDADYLVGTANPNLSAEIIVGPTPGGELGGTWGAPTIDPTHSGSAHHAQSHAVGGADHSGAITDAQHGARGPIVGAHGHDDLDTVSADQHHAQAHGAAAHSGDVIPAANQDFGAFFSDYFEMAAPATPAANAVRLYSRDKAGVSELFYKNDGGTERDLSAAGGAGAPTDAEYWTAAAHAGLSAERIHQVLRKTANQSITGGGPTVVDITELGFSIEAGGIYYVEWVLIINTSATTQGYRVMANGPALGAGSVNGHSELWTSGTAHLHNAGVVYDWGATTTTGPGASLEQISLVTCYVENGVNAGTLIARGVQETAAGTLTVFKGSFGRLWKF